MFVLQCTACNKWAFWCTGCKSSMRSIAIARHSRNTGGAKCTRCKALGVRGSCCNARLAVGLHSDARGANLRHDSSPLQCTAVVQKVQSSCIAILEARGVQVAMHRLQRVCILMHGVQISDVIHPHCNAQQEHRRSKAAALQSSRCEVFRLQCTACNKLAFGCTGCKSSMRSLPIARHSRNTGGAKCTRCKDLSVRSSGCNARLAMGLHSDAWGANL